jgi:hypothetical protein
VVERFHIIKAKNQQIPDFLVYPSPRKPSSNRLLYFDSTFLLAIEILAHFARISGLIQKFIFGLIDTSEHSDRRGSRDDKQKNRMTEIPVELLR